MKKLMLTVSLLSLAVAEVQAADLLTAIQDGKTTFQVRPRVEFVDDDGAAAADPAKAFTVRTAPRQSEAAAEASGFGRFGLKKQ